MCIYYINVCVERERERNACLRHTGTCRPCRTRHVHYKRERSLESRLGSSSAPLYVCVCVRVCVCVCVCVCVHIFVHNKREISLAKPFSSLGKPLSLAH